MNKRQNAILEILSRQEKADVTELSGLLGVSQVTIRKDLDFLAKTGIVKREHGFAVLSDTNDILGRLAYHYESKKKIAEAAASMVKDGETVMIESGSCCAILAETLASTKKGLTIITNSAFISDYVRSKTTSEIILLGGIYQHDSQVLVGPMVKQCAENFWVTSFFIGVDGYSAERGFTNKDQLRAQAVKDMARQADKVIVLTESRKFTEHGNVPLQIGDKLSAVITDTGIPEEIGKHLTDSRISLIRT